MPQYTITESVGNRVERVRSFEDLERHYPSSGREPGRDYGRSLRTAGRKFHRRRGMDRIEARGP